MTGESGCAAATAGAGWAAEPGSVFSEYDGLGFNVGLGYRRLSRVGLR